MLLSLYLCAVQATHEKQGRSLEDENGNGYNKYDEYKAEFQYNWEKTKYQVEEDLDGMWHTTPSEWGDEYWEVLIGIIGVALAITFCMMLVCCTPCCCSYADESPRYAATQEELDAKRKMKEPILDRGSGSKRIIDPPSQDPSSRSKVPRQRRRRTLWEETVIVWKDFFRNGLYVPDDNMSHYTREARDEQRRRRSRSASKRRKRSSSRNKRRGEMV